MSDELANSDEGDRQFVALGIDGIGRIIITRLQSKIVLPSPPSPNLEQGRGRGHESLYLNTIWYQNNRQQRQNI
ncbi:MAG: hypothetical protein HXY43_22595 [Fischerella sp.]|uniref:hypothetical protein n=1 Tax=Fischerella sp. TaxID=1191 RepID=UPI0017ADA6C2|nr:hypothetical protein [Fischerella sp.]NWF61962.1 hypothetical protein [Fischerella sp.]